ncbi:hypothetical protein PR202_gb11580 [Eleusine coracana subsp. coracana]|uniref:PTC1-like winged helix-turn-helix domain-containing protein n=1 Tax=Eleusine coracana subsp. coracana TaxID=191504 RepID=A0AAV5ENB5_ELECO|nr:hypothetical protein PR202_gb11580 [Eleusine coracana subsp. coracana]
MARTVQMGNFRIEPRSPLSRTEPDLARHLHIPPPGAFYEIDHEMLPPKSPIHLKSIRVVKVSECTSLDVTVCFPSLLALRSFFSAYQASGSWPELDERFVMSVSHAARILRRRVAEEELEGETPSSAASPSSPPAPQAANKLAPPAGSCLLTTLKCDGTGWGVRRRVRYIGRHRDDPKDFDGYETEAGVREEEPRPATREIRRSPRNCKRKREAERSSPGTHRDERNKKKKVQGRSKKSPVEKKRTVEAKDGDPRRGKDRWSAERYAAAEKSLLNIMLSRGARYGEPVMRPVLREEARKHIGDTGLLDHLLKHMAGRVPDGSAHRHMEQLLGKDGKFDAERAYISLKEKYQTVIRVNEKLEKKVLSLKDKFEHVGDKNDKLEEQITYLSSSYLSFKDQILPLLKMEGTNQVEVSPRAGIQEALPRTSLYAASGDQMTHPADGIVVQGGPDRAARKNSFRICKPQSTFQWPSMASDITTSGGASNSCPRPGLPRGTSRLSSSVPGTGLPPSSRAPFEVMATPPGPDEHMTRGALTTPPSASSTTLQLSLPSPRSPLQPQQLFGATATAAVRFSTSPGKQHLSGLTLRHVDSLSSPPSPCAASLLERKRGIFNADAGGIVLVGTELALATPSYC